MIRSCLYIDQASMSALDAAALAEADAVIFDGSGLVEQKESIAFGRKLAESGKVSAFMSLPDAASALTLPAFLGTSIAAGIRGFLAWKCLSLADIQMLDVLMSAQEAMAGLPDHSLRLICGLQAGFQMQPRRRAQLALPERIAGLVWDSDQTAAFIGCRRIVGETGAFVAPLSSLRTQVLVEAAHAAIPALDTLSWHAGTLFEQECHDAWEQGFSGKFCRSLEQVATVNRIFARPQ